MRQAVSMVAASPVSHDPQSSMAPVKVHQFQLLPWPAFIQSGGGGGDPLVATGGCPGVVADYAALPPDGDVIVQGPPAFQRLLSSFGGGHGSEDEDEDEAVVNVDEPPNGRSLAAALQQHAVAAVGYIHAGGNGVDALLATPTGTPTQHGIIC